MISRSIINFALFQGVWFMALLLEHNSLIPALVVVALMIYLSKQREQDSWLLLCGLPLALGYEWLASSLNLLAFKVTPFPLWLAVLWAALLLTINTSMQFLQKLPWYIAWGVCALFAPASYYAGMRFEVLNTELVVWQFWLVYGLGWASMFMAIIAINKRFLAAK
ncbi:DUF2878 domain-containing protein [Pseudoalteromonas sp. 2CM39R]|uniref:DUF2878 family protein n=1 Tax=Pseudoalteromonas sp. 2CM39R TaxID=2929856 RepID=UPI0020C06729|nr:DUF2878 family protein [Pseudoalteromonas sp. 2CM39R]MCK8124152.1 DUF2878 domain-containing protein [Pseudoalteromonas sp. 2CM39R]